MRRLCLAVLILVAAVLGCSKDPSPVAPAPAELTTMLESGDPQVQMEAAQWVVSLGPKAAETTPALIAALKSRHMTVRQNAALALGHVGPDAAATAVPALTKALEDPETSVRQVAAETLGKIGPAARSAIPALEKLAARPDNCNAAPHALKKIR